MFERMAMGWSLVRQSFQVLREDKKLVLFPVFSGIALLLVAASFLVPLFAFGQGNLLNEDNLRGNNPVAWIVLFLFYFVNYCVIFFFNAALVACAILRLKGQDPGLGDGLQIATARLPQILAWAAVSATVGLILRAIESRSERIGALVAGLLGAAWGAATYFVVPILVIERVGPTAAFRRSLELLKKTWGEALTANFGMGGVFFLVFLVMLLPIAVLVGLGVAALAAGQTVLGILCFVLVVGCLILTSLVSSTLQTIVVAAVFLYASEKTVAGPFDEGALSAAFAAK